MHPRQHLQELLHHAEKMAEIAEALGEDQRAPRQADAVISPEAVVATVIRHAHHRVMPVHISTSSWPLEGELGLFHRLQAELLAHRGSVRILYTGDLSSDPDVASSLQRLSEDGAGVRFYPCDLPAVSLVDGNTVIASTVDRYGRPKLRVIRDTGIERALQVFYSTVWNHAFTINTVREMGLDGDAEFLTLRELQLLGSGYTDEMAARKLNLSVRTYRRHIADLMCRLKAKSRFQAGALAERLGLIEPYQQAGTHPGAESGISGLEY